MAENTTLTGRRKIGNQCQDEFWKEEEFCHTKRKVHYASMLELTRRIVCLADFQTYTYKVQDLMINLHVRISCTHSLFSALLALFSFVCAVRM